MVSLEEIKAYFGDVCKTFPNAETGIDSKLSLTTRKIFYEIGLPNYKGYGGDYIMLDELKVVDKQYLQFATRDFDEEYYKECIDLETGKVVFNLSYDGNKNYFVLNSDLESYLMYIYTYIKFRLEVKIPQTLGYYTENHPRYAKELKKRLLQINKDVDKGDWASLIEEMDLGVV